MSRLGLWGPGSPFPTSAAADESNKSAIRNFIKTCQSRGVGAMELCALHLKREGALLARTLSYAGAEFSVVEATLTPEQIETYDRAAAVADPLHAREARLATMAMDRARRRRGFEEFGGSRRLQGVPRELPQPALGRPPAVLPVAHHGLQGAQARRGGEAGPR